MTKVRVNPPIVRARIAQEPRTTQKQGTLEKYESYISCEKFDTNSHMERRMIRTKQQALKAAQQRWGNAAAVRDSGRTDHGGKPWPTVEEREAARAESAAIRATPEPTDPSARIARRQRITELRSIMWRHRLAVGRIMPYLGAFMVEAEGDSWDECFEIADRKRAKPEKSQ